LAKAWLLLAELDNEACRFALLGEHAARAIDHARRAGAVREQHQGLGDLLLALRYGPTPVAEAVRRCEELAGQVRGDRFAELSGDQGFLATTSVELAEVLAGLGRDDEALRLTEVSEAIAAPGDLSAQVGWRRVRARLLARRGSVQEAERLATQAVRLAAGSDWLQGHGDALMDLAEVLASAGRSRGAADAARHAAGLYERKGNLVLAGRARRRLAELAAG